MVGCTPKNSRPSILLFCQENDKNRLKRLLDPEFLKRINCRSPYKSKSRVLSWASIAEKPDLWIYIFPFSTNPTKRIAGPEPTVVSLNIRQASSFCGALVKYQGRVATVGLTVEIDGIARLLTVDHIFQEDALDEHPEEKNDDDDSLWDYDSGDEGEEMFSVASGALELSQNDARLTPIRSSHEEDKGVASASHTYCQVLDLNEINTHQPIVADKYTDQGHKVAASLTAAPTGREVSAHRVDSQNELPHRQAYLDWACLELDEERMETWSKSYISTDPDTVPVLLEEIGDAPTSHATSVLMISGIKGIRPGKLVADAGYLGSLRRQDMCVVWTLILDSAPGLVPGECGAVVVDKETYKIYGHVVGANVLGHAYVVPFRGVLDQIKTAFGTDLVHFPCKSSPLATWNLYSDEDLLSRRKDKKSRSNHAKAPGPESDSVSSKKSTAIASARDIDPYKRSTYSSAGSIYRSGTSYANPRYVAESRKKREYAMGHTGVAPPDPRRPAHDRAMQAASNLPGRTLQASSRPVAYATQLTIDGSDDEIYRGSSNHGHDGPKSGGQGSSSDLDSSNWAYDSRNSGGQQSSSYYTSTSDGQGGSSYYGSNPSSYR
ncbi:rna binding protein [Colletotrichum asianum]